ncbi:MAG: DivIVA domain-containing protein [Acidimicrobiales bacterium]
MELTLKRMLEHAEFKKYRGKGYDPTEVDDFLDKAVAMAGKVEVQLQALEQAKGSSGGPSPAEVEAEVERRVAERLADQPAPAAPAGPSEDEIAEEARRTLAMAQRTADAAVREARDDAAQIVSSAQEQAATLVADAEAAAQATRAEADGYAATTRADADAYAASTKEGADGYATATKAEVDAEAARERREARQRLASEIGELEGQREQLRADVGVLERHVEEQRSQLGSTLAELQQLLDDPTGFRMAPVPALADPELPDFSDLDEPAPRRRPTARAATRPALGGRGRRAAEAPVAAIEVEEEIVIVEVEATAPLDGAPDAPQDEAPAPAELDAASVADEPPPAPEPGSLELPVVDPSAERPAPLPLAFDEVDHEAPGLGDVEAGPPTAPVSRVELGVEGGGDDDAFLAELRKAMADDEPLGPRDDVVGDRGDDLFEDDDRRGWRFGRRR